MNDRRRKTGVRCLLVFAAVGGGACKLPSTAEVSPDSKTGGAADLSRDSGAVARRIPLRPTADGGRPCMDATTCDHDEYCAFEPRLCGVSSKPVKPEYEVGLRPGTCRPRPLSCGAAYSPVCGCDKRVYGSECEAHLAGVDLNVNDGCFESSPRDWISCGERFCDAHTQYCEIVLSDVFELPTDYTCKALPPACIPDAGSPRSCDCFAKGTRCLDWCGYIPSGEHGLSGFHLTCRL